MKKSVVVLGAGALMLASAGAAFAHHSGAMFDAAKVVTITGTVKEFRYTNPHSWLYVTTTDADGKATDWAFEAEGPSALLRAGI
jgi:hypothetical protein